MQVFASPPPGVRGPTIQTANGWYFDYTRPSAGRVDIETVAHALSHICRFTGHCVKFYSVAEHCVRMSYIVPPEDALWALGHEAGEPMVGDMNKPLKMMVPAYDPIEDGAQRHILVSVFGLDPDARPDTIKPADWRMLATEQRDLMPKQRAVRWDAWGFACEWELIPEEDQHWTWTHAIEPLPDVIQPWEPTTAKLLFLQRFRELAFGRDLAPMQRGTLLQQSAQRLVTV